MTNPPILPQEPSLYQWFAGASAGYLIENEEDMYHAHIGVDLPHQRGGWNQAVFLEIGYTELSGCVTASSTIPGAGEGSAYYDDSPLVSALLQYGEMCFDMEIIPVTLNYKAERPLGQNLNLYLGLGAGVAFIDAEASVPGMSESDDDTVFYAQGFGGVVYNVNPSFELFAGARVIYFDEPEFTLFSTNVDLDDLDALGFEVENTDVLVELGGRFNF